MDTQWSTEVGMTRYRLNVADPSLIPVKVVADAVIDVCERRATMIDLSRQWRASVEAIEKARRDVSAKAAALAIKKKELPKDIRRAVKDAEEEAEVSTLAFRAAEAAFVNSFQILKAEFNANRAGLEAAALKNGELALTKMAAARKSFELAAVEAHAAYGVLGMFAENADTGDNQLVYREPRSSRRRLTTDAALAAMGEAVGHTNLALDWYKTRG